MENCCQFDFYNNTLTVFDIHFPLRFLENLACKKELNKLHHNQVIVRVCTLIDQSVWQKSLSSCKSLFKTSVSTCTLLTLEHNGMEL